MTPPRPSPQPAPDRVVTVGLRTQRDTALLAVGFHRLFPIEQTAGFDDLLRQLDALPPRP